MAEDKAQMEERMVQPVTADDVTRGLPPPSYEEVMGAYETSVRQQTHELPPLAYIDIMPRCVSVGNIPERIAPKFTPFSDIIDGANAWLHAHPDLLIWKCETVQRKVSKGPEGGLIYDLQNMLRHDATYGYQVYVRGVRMWLTKNPNPGDPPQKLGLKNVLPAKINIAMPLRYQGMYPLMMVGQVHPDGQVNTDVNVNVGFVGRTFQTFVGLAKTIEELNKNLQSDPLPGKILTVETETIKAKESFHSDLHPEASCWTEDKMKFKRFTQVIRIYYLQGTPAKEEIGLEEFQPEMVSRGDALKKPRFENMSNTFSRISAWLPTAVGQGRRVVNIQQFDARVHSSLFTGEVEIGSDSTDEMEYALGGNAHVLKTIRVFTTKSSAIPTPPAPVCVTSRLFLPVPTGSRGFETMCQTMERIEAWLKVTGLPVYSVETVELLHSAGMGHERHQDRPDYLLGNSGRHWITGIRLYFPNIFNEPDPSLLPALPAKSSSCAIL